MFKKASSLGPEVVLITIVRLGIKQTRCFGTIRGGWYKFRTAIRALCVNVNGKLTHYDCSPKGNPGRPNYLGHWETCFDLLYAMP